jgi:hypothetical protein
MNNEPVAWKHKPSGMIFDEIIEAVEPDDLVPLYTHPADLTDEEIKALWKPLPDTKTYDSDVLKFARAILKKASEK